MGCVSQYGFSMQVNGDSDANQCSYGETSRAAKRGGPYIATVADFPQPSLYVSLPDKSNPALVRCFCKVTLVSGI